MLTTISAPAGGNFIRVGTAMVGVWLVVAVFLIMVWLTRKILKFLNSNGDVFKNKEGGTLYQNELRRTRASQHVHKACDRGNSSTI